MSDLTITTAGVTESKASGAEVLQPSKKLTQMNINSFDITATLTPDGHSADVMFVTTKIENAVATKGGSAILQSLSAVLTNHASEASGNGSNATGAFKLVFTSNSQVLGTVSDLLGTRTVDGGGTGDIDNWSRAVLGDTLAIVNVSNVVDMGELAVASKTNIGAVLTAASDSRDIYVWGITDSTNDYNGATISLKFGIVQD
tara:strand:- start:2975 stop:3577 length:603 start_codon:yes stop_codon:yes gene_type:complete